MESIDKAGSFFLGKKYDLANDKVGDELIDGVSDGMVFDG